LSEGVEDCSGVGGDGLQVEADDVLGGVESDFLVFGGVSVAHNTLTLNLFPHLLFTFLNFLTLISQPQMKPCSNIRDSWTCLSFLFS